MTNHYIDIPDTPLMEAARWGRAVIGPAEFIYPHAKGWVINSLDKPYNLTQLTVKRLTAIFRSPLEVSPTCTTSWPERLKTQRTIPWDLLGPLIHSPATTTKDIHSSPSSGSSSSSRGKRERPATVGTGGAGGARRRAIIAAASGSEGAVA